MSDTSLSMIASKGVIVLPSEDDRSLEGPSVEHYPGKHDQLSHGRKYGSAKTSTTGKMQGMSFDEKHRAMRQGSAKWRSSLSSAQKDALATYTGGAYDDINTALRKGTVKKQTPSMQKTIKNADAALQQGSLGEAVLVHRGIKNTSGERWAMFQKNVGKTFTDPAFGSTSLDPTVAQSFIAGHSKGILIEIHVPKGAKGGYVQPMSLYPSEYEYLLPPNTQYKVYSATIDSTGQHRVVLGVANR